jgi:hypothetical protein
MHEVADRKLHLCSRYEFKLIVFTYENKITYFNVKAILAEKLKEEN